MFKNKLFKVAYAISIAEGWLNRGAQTQSMTGSESYANHNPGNIKESPFQCDKMGEFAVFENDIIGFFAIVFQLWLYTQNDSGLAATNLTLYDWICTYNGTTQGTPEAENYIATIERVGEVSRDDTIKSLLA